MSPVRGSSGICPEQNSRLPARIAWTYGPTAAGASGALTDSRFDDKLISSSSGSARSVLPRSRRGSLVSVPNRLAGESSPYLLQHKDNPVDWYPWGQEALSLAAARDRPLPVSIGYSACHWCHVMEHQG